MPEYDRGNNTGSVNIILLTKSIFYSKVFAKASGEEGVAVFR